MKNDFEFDSEDDIDLDAAISAMMADTRAPQSPDLIGTDTEQPGPHTSTSTSTTTTIEERPPRATTSSRSTKRDGYPAPPPALEERRSDFGVSKTLGLYETLLRRQIYHLGQAQNLQANVAAEEIPQHFRVSLQPRLSGLNENEKAKAAWYAILHKTSRALMRVATQHHFHLADESQRKAGAVRCLLIKHPDVTDADLAACKTRSRKQPQKIDTPPPRQDNRRRHQSYPSSRGHKRARRE